MQGHLVYEPNVSLVDSPFAERLSRAGLSSLVAAPLLSENRVFGVLIAARQQADGFTSGECEFLRQLSEHVALAAHQAQIHAALQQAYDDLRQTQQTVMQQERLRALGQMASGIAHDINNAISPVALYTESLLENEPNLSVRTRACLETTQRAIEDVAHTVARMREFYRQREPQLTLAPVDLGSLVQQVVDLTRARWSDMPQQRGIVIQLRTEVAPGLPAVAGIESEIREALTNLIFNAVDAMPEGGTLTLRTRAEKGASPAAQAAASVRGSDRHRRGHGRRNAPPVSGAVLYHQRRARHWPGSGDGLWRDPTAQCGDRNRKRSWQRHHHASQVPGPCRGRGRLIKWSEARCLSVRAFWWWTTIRC